MKLLNRLTKQLSSRVKDAKGLAVALLKKRGQMTPEGKLTAKGRARQKLGAAGRAKSRAAKYSGGKPSQYKYNAKTNRATKSK